MPNSQHNIVAFPQTAAPEASASPPDGHATAVVIPIGDAISLISDHPSSQPAVAPPLDLGELWNAINEKRVVAHYQPQFDFSSGHTVAVEALARIVDESGALILPARFIELAEESAMIVPLGRAIIAQACEDLARWRAEGVAVERMAINLSAHQLNVDESLARYIDDCAAAHGLTAADLEFELTERQFLDSNGTGATSINAIAELGAGLALDDFGIGYSSVAYLSDLPVTTVKLDRNMVARIPEHQTTERVIRHLVAMALDIGVNVVAEGIETWDQHDYLASTGCHLGQGFLFAEAMHAEDLTGFVGCIEGI